MAIKHSFIYTTLWCHSTLNPIPLSEVWLQPRPWVSRQVIEIILITWAFKHAFYGDVGTLQCTLVTRPTEYTMIRPTGNRMGYSKVSNHDTHFANDGIKRSWAIFDEWICWPILYCLIITNWNNYISIHRTSHAPHESGMCLKMLQTSSSCKIPITNLK